MAQGVSWPLSLPFLLGVPDEGLPCDVGCLVEGATDPSPASLKDVIFCRLLPRSLPQFLVTDGVRPANLKNPSEAGDQCLDSLQGAAMNS